MSGSKKSLKNEKTVHGITVKKLPIGAYISALEEAAQLPSEILEKLFPDRGAEFSLSAFSQLGKQDALNVILKAMVYVPGEIIGFLGRLLDAGSLLETLAPDELADVITAFWEINKIENFISKVKALVMQAR